MPGTYTSLLYHIVFSTKQREPLIGPSLRRELYKYMGGLVRGQGGVANEIGGMPDHIHLLVSLKTEPSVAEFVKVIKAKSSKWVNEQKLIQGRFSWQVGDGAFTVSCSQFTRVRSYIKNQQQHHRRLSFQDEFKGFLKKHHIAYEERYLWD